MKYIFEARMEVRDYECDIEGIVNNANYLHYAEHTRHLFLRSLGVSFAKLHEQGIDAVVHSMKLQYKVPLRCDDEFISRLNLKIRISTVPVTNSSASAPLSSSYALSMASSPTVLNTTKPSRTIFKLLLFPNTHWVAYQTPS